MPGTAPEGSALMRRRSIPTPLLSKCAESIACPMAVITMSAGRRISGWSALMGFGRPFSIGPESCGCTAMPTAWSFSVSMRTGESMGMISQPSAMAPSISSRAAVISSMRRR